MTNRAEGRITVSQWDEVTYDEVEGAPKLTRVVTKATYTGTMEGEGMVGFLMAYLGEGVPFVGVERFTGKLNDRSGSVVLEHHGVYGSNGILSEMKIVDGSGSGGLLGMRGVGRYVWPAGAEVGNMTLEYEFGAG